MVPVYGRVFVGGHKHELCSLRHAKLTESPGTPWAPSRVWVQLQLFQKPPRRHLRVVSNVISSASLFPGPARLCTVCPSSWERCPHPCPAKRNSRYSFPADGSAALHSYHTKDSSKYSFPADGSAARSPAIQKITPNIPFLLPLPPLCPCQSSRHIVHFASSQHLPLTMPLFKLTT